MKNSSDPQNGNGPEERSKPSLDLEFPNWSGHIPARYWSETVDEMHRRCEALLPLIKKDPLFAQRRLEDKIDVPFEL
jgi:hypothetical protein